MCLRFSRFNIDIYLPMLQFIRWHSNSFAIKLLSLGLRLHSDIWMALQRNHIRICGHSLVISVNSTTKITWRISIIDLSSTCLIRDITWCDLFDANNKTNFSKNFHTQQKLEQQQQQKKKRKNRTLTEKVNLTIALRAAQSDSLWHRRSIRIRIETTWRSTSFIPVYNIVQVK